MANIRSPLTLQASDQPRTGRRAALDLLRPYQRAALEDARQARPYAPLGGGTGMSIVGELARHPPTPVAFIPPLALTREAEEVLAHYHAHEALRTGDVRASRIIQGCHAVIAGTAAVELQASVRVLWAAWQVGTSSEVLHRAEAAVVACVEAHRARVGGGS